MMKLRFLGLCILLAAPCLWAEAYYCTNSSRLVSIGMSVNDVIQACGTPAQNKTETVQQAIDRKILNQWGYFSKQNRAPWTKTVPAELMISLYANKVERIMINNQPVQGGIDCFGNGLIQLGDAADKVLRYCGQPDTRQKKSETIMGAAQTKRVLTYTRSDNMPPVFLEFLDDKLTHIRYGS